MRKADEVAEERRVRPCAARVGGKACEVEQPLDVRRREVKQVAGHTGLCGQRVRAH